ncbi:MAG: hypothetical protein OXC40_01010 [Proteobacteria bacterium]|nr:hypothetical protein [Pseudomonadota bacterium]
MMTSVAITRRQPAAIMFCCLSLGMVVLRQNHLYAHTFPDPDMRAKTETEDVLFGSPNQIYPGYLGAHTLKKKQLNVGIFSNLAYGITDEFEIGTLLAFNYFQVYNLTLRFSRNLTTNQFGTTRFAFTVHQFYEHSFTMEGKGLKDNEHFHRFFNARNYLYSLFLRPAYTTYLSPNLLLTVEGLHSLHTFINFDGRDLATSQNIVKLITGNQGLWQVPLPNFSHQMKPMRELEYHRINKFSHGLVAGLEYFFYPTFAVKSFVLLPVVTFENVDMAGLPQTEYRPRWAVQSDIPRDFPLLLLLARKNFQPLNIQFGILYGKYPELDVHGDNRQVVRKSRRGSPGFFTDWQVMPIGAISWIIDH